MHNLRSAFDHLPQIEAEFLENARHIRNQPKSGVVLYHEILAIAEADREQVTEEMLVDLTREYLQRRAPNALAYGKAQFDTDSPHIHLMISGNLIESKQKLRLERSEFERIKREMEAYQIEKYPQLSHSVVYGKQKQKNHDRPILTQGEQERARRLKDHGDKSPTRKEDARARLQTCLIEAQSEGHLIELMRAAQLAPYVRGKTPGVLDTQTGRKYRLSTLGLDREGQATVQLLRRCQSPQSRTDARLQQIADIRLLKMQRHWLHLGFRNDIVNLLQPKNQKDLCVKYLHQGRSDQIKRERSIPT